MVTRVALLFPKKYLFFMPSQEKDLFSIAESLHSENDPINYKEFVEYDNGEKADGTLIQYMRYLSHLDFNPLATDPEPSTVEINGFSLSNIKRWATLKAKKRGVDTTRFKYNTYVALKNYLEAVGETDKLRELPESRQIEKPSSKSPTTYYTEEQIQKILEAISDNNQQLRQTVIHMFYAGMRTYEVLNLKPSWYEFPEDEAAEIEIPAEYAKGKKNSKEPEYCFIPSRFKEEVKKYILNQHDTKKENLQDFIQETEPEEFNHLFKFIDDSDKDFKALARERYHLNKELKKVAKKSGINKAEKISAHRLRKSFIHHIYEGEDGLNLSRTSKLARHENTDLTDRHYLNIEKQEIKKDYQQVIG